MEKGMHGAKNITLNVNCTPLYHRSLWPRIIRRRSAATRLLISWVRIPPGHGYLSVVSVVCCFCEELITHQEESYRLCCVVVCDLETS